MSQFTYAASGVDIDAGERAVTGWTGQQAGSATVPGGAEDALRRP